jgi:hypothetical protein
MNLTAGYKLRMRFLRSMCKNVVVVCIISFGACTSYQDAEEGGEDPALIDKSGPVVTVEGTARNAKAGAVLVTDKAEVFYIAGKEMWEPVVEEGRRLSVTGEQIETDYLESEIQQPDSLPKATMEKQKMIKNAKYTLMHVDTTGK